MASSQQPNSPPPTQGGQADLFEDRLPFRPYCAHDPSEGLIIRGRRQALTFPYVQLNPPHLIVHVVLDVDRPDGWDRWHQRGLPRPTYNVVNPANGHAHTDYALLVPVARHDAARPAPARYVAAVQAALTDHLGADPRYKTSAVVSKNPCYEGWHVDRGSKLYTLKEMIEHPAIDLKGRGGPRPNTPLAGLGRNCHTFDATRRHAYRFVSRYWDGPPEPWFDHLLAWAEAHTREHHEIPLPDPEIRHLAKSIAQWVWPPRFTPEGRKAWHVAGGRASRGGGRPGLGDPWKGEGKSRRTWFRHRSGR